VIVRIYQVRVNQSMDIVAYDEKEAQDKFLKYLKAELLASELECEFKYAGEELEG